MRRRSVRVLLMLSVLVSLLVVATPRAQRPFGGGYSQSYSGNVKYDGKFVFVRISYPWSGRPRRAVGARLAARRGAPAQDSGRDHGDLGAHDREQHHGPVAIRNCSSFRSRTWPSPGSGDMNDNDVRALARLSQQGRLPDPRRLPRPRLEQRRAAGQPDVPGRPLGGSRRHASDLPLVLRDQLARHRPAGVRPAAGRCSARSSRTTIRTSGS